MSELPQLQIGDETTFTIAVRDIFATPVDAIVNPANKGLSHGGGLAETISRMAGDALDKECDDLIARDGILDTSDAVLTTAGLLNFKAVIHAVGPQMGSGNEQQKLEETLWNVLNLAKQAEPAIESVAFPMISTGVYCVPKQICAQAFANVMKHYLSLNSAKKIKAVWLCVGLKDFDIFAQHFDKSLSASTSHPHSEEEIAEFELSEKQLMNEDNSDIDDWFN